MKAPTAPEGGTAWARWAWARFRRWAEGRPADADAAARLASAGILRTPEEFSALRLAGLTVAAMVGGIVGGALAILGWAGFGLDGAILLGVAWTAALPGVVAAYFHLAPRLAAQDRRHRLEADLRPALAYAAALGSAEVPVDEILRGLAEEPTIYGEVAREAGRIVRDTDLLGQDILSALRAAAVRTPSPRFQEFLEGIVTTAESGGQLKTYLLDQARRYERESPARLARSVESLSLLAEFYVVVVVAFPLFLLILLTVFSLLGGGSTLLLTVWLLVALLVPLTQLGFIVGVASMPSEGTP
ncbi:MAG: type II secretion system F family protein [Thermoplasmata archaeon]